MDQLAKDVRKLLRRKYGLDTSRPQGITAVFSIEPRRDPLEPRYDEATGGFQCVCPHGANEFHSCEERSQIDGSVAFVTAAFGMHIAGVVVRRIAHGR
jgi:tRNA A37 threonylcarbamoyladenosine dehydratase